MDLILKNRKIENGILVPFELQRDDKKEIRVTDDYIDISYKSMETPSRTLSNLYPCKFNYFGRTVNSIEAAIQSLKYKDEDVRFACYEYAGIDAWHLRGMFPYDWQKDGILYTPNKPMDRFTEEYQEFVDELYYMVFQNPKYKLNLIQSGNKALDHTMGENDVHRTTLTRTEYVSRLYALRHCALNQLTEKEEVIKVLIKVRQELK